MFAVFAYKTKISVILKSDSKKMYSHSVELNVVAVKKNVNTFLFNRV